MQDRDVKFSFDRWVDAVRFANTPDKALSDEQLQQALSLASPEAARDLRRRVRSAIRAGAFDFLRPAKSSGRRYSAQLPTRQRDAKRDPEQPEAPISEWYAPHRS
jgi:hypothetical protein